MYKNILLMSPPFVSRYDSGGSRFQATRKTKSRWYPYWLCKAAALLEENGINTKVIDCPAQNIGIEKVKGLSKAYGLVVIETSTPSFENDLNVAREIKKSDCDIVFVGPHITIKPEEALNNDEIDYIAMGEYEFTLLELAKGKNKKNIKGLGWKNKDKPVINSKRKLLENLAKIPFASEIYKRDLDVKKYHLPFVTTPYVSVYTGRGCPYECTFCLWPQTFTGKKYRTRTIENVVNEVGYIKENMPQVKEIFFDDDTFTINKKRVEKLCDKLKKIDIRWSVNVRADLDYELLKKMKDSGCRTVVAGYESGCQKILDNVKKGVTVRQLERFTQDCNKAGLMIHGTFILGLPGETKQTIKQTLNFVKKLNLDTIQVTVAMPLPGTEFYNHCIKNNFLKKSDLVDDQGYQSCIVEYPELSADEIKESVETFHKKYFFRLKYIWKLLKQMKNAGEAKRIIKNYAEFQSYLIKRWLND